MRNANGLFYLLMGHLFLSSCASTSHMTLRVNEPAPVSLPSYVKRVGLINRSNVSEKNKVVDLAEKVFTLEGRSLDKEGSASSIQGLSDELLRNNRFEEVSILKDKLTTVNPSTFPSPLSWDEVETICRNNQMDALFSLELFDTDSKMAYSANPVQVRTPLGQLPGIEHEARLSTLVKTGWRIYDPRSRRVLDEFAVSRTIHYSGKGINPVIAANALIDRKEAVKEVGNQSGQAYALRIVPYSIRVARDYFIRGTPNFKIARRRAQTGNWDDAATLWMQETQNRKNKLAGRACYNMAIISEINGHLEDALHWAQRSYEDYANRLALRYVNILKDRKSQVEILHAQESAFAIQE